MQTLDARHMELFLSEGFRNGRWEYKLIGTKDIGKIATGASGAIFDIKHLNDASTSSKTSHKLCGSLTATFHCLQGWKTLVQI